MEYAKYLTQDPVVPDDMALLLADSACCAGAVATFLGIVRADHQGTRRVCALRYEAYGAMATAQINRLIGAACTRWLLKKVYVRHRVGLVGVGEIALAVAVAAVHRAEAFAALRFITEGIKHDVPIWKCTHYSDDTRQWEQDGSLAADRVGEEFADAHL